MSDIQHGVLSVKGTAWSTAAAGLCFLCAAHASRPVVAAGTVFFGLLGSSVAEATLRKQQAAADLTAG